MPLPICTKPKIANHVRLYSAAAAPEPRDVIAQCSIAELVLIQASPLDVIAGQAAYYRRHLTTCAMSLVSVGRASAHAALLNAARDRITAAEQWRDAVEGELAAIRSAAAQEVTP